MGIKAADVRARIKELKGCTDDCTCEVCELDRKAKRGWACACGEYNGDATFCCGKCGGSSERGEMIEERRLERFEACVVLEISEELATEFAEKAGIDFEYLSEWTKDTILMRIKQPIWGAGPFLGEPIKHPANWKEAVKQRFAPRWFKRRWPVKFTVHRFEARVLYPMVSFPKDRAFASVDVVTD